MPNQTPLKNIHLIMAARPNIMKIAPLFHALKQTTWANPILIHTGQHYDDNMSGAFLRDLNLPLPHHHLNIGSGTHAQQTGNTMIAYETLCQQNHPDFCVVAGDVNATIACALTAKKLNIPVAHIEAGLRSHDRTMPEEINRLATDAISDWFWTPSPDATQNLLAENIPAHKINCVGNFMIDSFIKLQPIINANNSFHEFSLQKNNYALITFHRPSNVDSPQNLNQLLVAIQQITTKIPTIFPIHPRTRSKFEQANKWEALNAIPNLIICPPQAYINFMNLITNARLVITDSGGLQEETSFIGIPCLTLRPNTERPITLSQGTNQLINFANLNEKITHILNAPMPKAPTIQGWDGASALRASQHLKQILFAQDATI